MFAEIDKMIKAARDDVAAFNKCVPAFVKKSEKAEKVAEDKVQTWRTMG